MTAIRIAEFDIWRAGYAAAVVKVYEAGTTTLASIYTDEALSVAAANPQTLLSQTVGGIAYGKFTVPLYVGEAYELDINSTDQTGVVRPPIESLAGQDASAATVLATGATATTTLAAMAARTFYVTGYGAFTTAGSAATNNATLTAAIGAAAAAGGGDVILPAGTFQFNQVTIPANVRVVGQGRGVTTLQSNVAGIAITWSGARAGLARLTIDGTALVAGSTGVYFKAENETVFDDVEVKRFETGVHARGGRRARWRGLFVTNCVTGAKMHGDDDVGGGADGDEFRDNLWIGGVVSQCSTIGVDLSYVDLPCIGNTIQGVGFEDNTGAALQVNGARYTRLPACWWSGNTTDLVVQDDDDTSDAARLLNTVIGLFIDGGEMDGGAATFTGTCQDVVLAGMELKDVDFSLDTPILNPILLRDCTEDSDVTISGEGTKLIRFNRTNSGASSGITTGATTAKAWSVRLNPGQKVYIEAKVIGRQRNGVNDGYYHLAVSANRPGSTLAYDTQTANFTLGDILTGASSGATARIVADSDSGTTGTLTLQDIVGDFEDNEIVTDESGGSATVNGSLVEQNAALKGSVTAIRAAQETDADWNATIAANGFEIEVQVTGDADQIVEWTVDVVVSSN